MLLPFLDFSRFIVAVVIIGSLLSSLALLVYEMTVEAMTLANVVHEGSLLRKAVALVVGLIETVDVFLIAIAV